MLTVEVKTRDFRFRRNVPYVSCPHLWYMKGPIHHRTPSLVKTLSCRLTCYLFILLMSSPFFTGPIPESLGHLDELRVLKLNGNKLTGEC